MARMLALLKGAALQFMQHRVASRGAALAFYTVTSIAPIVVIVIAVASLVVGQEAATGAVQEQFRALLGTEGADALQKGISSASERTNSITASVISVVTLLFGASGVFLELEDALNAMWGVESSTNLWSLARGRVASVGLVIALGFLLMVSLIADAALKSVSGYLPVEAFLLLIANTIITFALMTILFAGIFKYLPAKRVVWRDVFLGALVTASLFEIGKHLIGFYLSRSETASALGAAGALLGLLFWVYYSGQIFLFGAALTVEHSNKRAAAMAAVTP